MTDSSDSNVVFIKETYRDLLAREPDAEGMPWWLDDLEKRGQTRDDVVANIKLSEEYKSMDS